MYAYGHGALANATDAKAYAERACELKDGGSCELRAVLDGPPSAASASWLALGCEAGHGESCFILRALEASSEIPVSSGNRDDGCTIAHPSAEACAAAAAAVLQRAEPDATRVALGYLRAIHDDSLEFGVCDLGSDLDARISIRMASCCGVMRPCIEGCEAQCSAELSDRRAWLKRPLERACVAGAQPYCYALGALLEHGSTIQFVGEASKIDEVGALQVFTRSCKAGFAPSCTAAGSLHAARATAPTRTPEAAAEEGRFADEQFAKACQASQATACFKLADRRGVPRGLPDYERACDLGMRGVCADLADMYADGSGVPRDPARALALSRKAH